ncbi:MAG: hypothetical protein ACRC8Q_02530 [Aeromonas sp.]
MGLYNNVADSMAGGGGMFSNIMNNVEGMVGDGIGAATGALSSMAGGGKLANRIADKAANVATQAASSALTKYVPQELRNAIDSGASVAGSLLTGDFEGAGMKILDSGLVDGVLGRLSTGGDVTASNARFMGTANPLYGGITPAEAKRIHSQVISTKRAKKNLFLLSVSSLLKGDFSQQFNLFCVEISHTPFNISGDKTKVGASYLDMPSGSEADELRITTLDDKRGTLKRWFEDHAAAVAARDGSVGLPGQYAITFTIEHAFVGESGGFTGKGLYRPVTYDVSLSRREDALEEIQMTFTQIDTFMRP